MKKNILTFILIFVAYNLFAEKNDTTLVVSLEHTKNQTSQISLVFNNTSNDTICLVSQFENFIDFMSLSGFQVILYVDKEPHNSLNEDVPLEYRNYTYSSRIKYIYPRQEVKFVVPLEYKIGIPNKEKEYGVQLIINYTYSQWHDRKNIKSKSFRNVKTNYIIIKKVDEEWVIPKKKRSSKAY